MGGKKGRNRPLQSHARVKKKVTLRDGPIRGGKTGKVREPTRVAERELPEKKKFLHQPKKCGQSRQYKEVSSPDGGGGRGQSFIIKKRGCRKKVAKTLLFKKQRRPQGGQLFFRNKAKGGRKRQKSGLWLEKRELAKSGGGSRGKRFFILEGGEMPTRKKKRLKARCGGPEGECAWGRRSRPNWVLPRGKIGKDERYRTKKRFGQKGNKGLKTDPPCKKGGE